MASSSINLPVVTVQPDFLTVVSDVQERTVPDEDFWISCYKTGETSVHGKVRVGRGEHGVELTSRLGVEFERGANGVYTVACPELSIMPTRIRLPRLVFRDPEGPDSRQSRQINAFDISPDLTQFATGYNDGSVRRRPAGSSTSVTPTVYRPHLSVLTSLRFFPSSRVLLAAAADFSLTILDADPQATTPPPPARTLKGHLRSVTDTAIIARGRNVLSCAKDGTVRLWDVGGGKQITMLSATRYAPVLKMALGEKGSEWGKRPPDGEDAAPPPLLDPREVDTADKLLFCALGDGAFEAFDLGSKTSVFHSGTAGARVPLMAIAYAPAHNMLATGSSKGVVTVYDTRELSKPLTSFSRNTASVEDLAFTFFGTEAADNAQVGLVVASEDGLPYVAGVRPEGPDVLAELMGSDCEGIRVIRVDCKGGIWTAGDDGVVRLY